MRTCIRTHNAHTVCTDRAIICTVPTYISPFAYRCVADWVVRWRSNGCQRSLSYGHDCQPASWSKRARIKLSVGCGFLGSAAAAEFNLSSTGSLGQFKLFYAHARRHQVREVFAIARAPADMARRNSVRCDRFDKVLAIVHARIKGLYCVCARIRISIRTLAWQ